MARSWSELKAIPLSPDVVAEINAKIKMERELILYLQSDSSLIDDEENYRVALHHVESADSVLLGTPEEVRLTKLIEVIESYRAKFG